MKNVNNKPSYRFVEKWQQQKNRTFSGSFRPLRQSGDPPPKLSAFQGLCYHSGKVSHFPLPFHNNAAHVRATFLLLWVIDFYLLAAKSARVPICHFSKLAFAAKIAVLPSMLVVFQLRICQLSRFRLVRIESPASSSSVVSTFWGGKVIPNTVPILSHIKLLVPPLRYFSQHSLCRGFNSVLLSLFEHLNNGLTSREHLIHSTAALLQHLVYFLNIDWVQAL